METEFDAIKKFKTELSLENIPENLRTEKVCVLALSEDFSANIEYVPNEIKTEKFLSKRIQSERRALEIASTPNFMPGNTDLLLQYIPEKLKTLTVCLAAIEHNHSNINYVPKEMLTAEFYREMVMANGEVIQFLPEDLKTEELCRHAFENNIDSIRYIPESIVTEADCERYITEAYSISALPKKYITPRLLALGVRSKSHRSDRDFFNRAIPEALKTPELMFELIKLDAHYLYRFERVFEELGIMNEQSLMKMVSINAHCLGEVSNDLLTEEMCLTALETQYKEFNDKGPKQGYRPLLKFFPKQLIDEKIAEKATTINGLNLQYIPTKLKSEELIQSAIASEITYGHLHKIIKYIPKKMISEAMCITAMNEKWGGFDDIPDNMKTERVCQAAMEIHDVWYVLDKIPKEIYIPEVLIHCKKLRYPNLEKFTQLMNEWAENEAASNDDFALLLANAPESLKKSDVWKKWALIYL